MAKPTLIDRLWASLPPPAHAALTAAVELCVERKDPLYLVGGGVRDLLLSRPVPDLDLVVEGDALAFAGQLGHRLGSAAEFHEDFLTATVRTAEGVVLDLASSRRETYSAPAALPLVAPAPLAEDLGRRDFSVNSLALRLGPDDSGRLVDLFDGVDDLEAGRLRVLHRRSFVDDPTRILRGLELEQRLEMRFDGDTEARAREALAAGRLSALSGERRRSALLPVLAAALDAPALADRLSDLGLPQGIHPALRLGRPERRRLDRFSAVRRELAALAEPRFASEPWRLTWSAMSWTAAAAARRSAAESLALSSGASARLAAIPQRVGAAAEDLAVPALAPHRAAAALRSWSDEELVALAAESRGAPREWARRELTQFRRLRLVIGGGDLLTLGASPGPAIGRALAATLDARLDGRIGADDELGFAADQLGVATAEPPAGRRR